MNIQEIYNKANEAGACNDKGLSIIKSSKSIDDLINLLVSPQGIEFCMSKAFPSIDILQKHEEKLKAKNIFIKGNHCISSIGKVVVFGGEVEIKVNGFDVVDIYATNDAKVKVIANDNAYVVAELHHNAQMEFERYGMAQVKKFIK